MLKEYIQELSTVEGKKWFLEQVKQKLSEETITESTELYWTLADLIAEAMIREAKIQEAMKDILPKSLEEKVRKKSWREKIKKKHGAKAFLDPKNLEFPVYDERGPHCGLIYAAYVRARQWHHNKIAEKAKNMFKRNGCAKKLGIEIRD